MDYKILKGFALVVLMLTLTGCPGDGGLTKLSIATVDNLVTVNPLKNSYKVGDEIIFKIEIPSTNEYFGKSIDLYNKTKDNTPRFETLFPLIYDNNVTAVKGVYNPTKGNFHSLAYNNQTRNYELEFRVILNVAGNFTYNKYEMIDVNGQNYNFKIYTSVNGIDPTQSYQITVE